MNFVVQTENFRQMKDFIALARKWNANSVYFSRIRNWTGVEAGLFGAMDVFSPGHPLFAEAKRLLNECKEEEGLHVLYNM